MDNFQKSYQTFKQDQLLEEIFLRVEALEGIQAQDQVQQETTIWWV